MLKKKGEKRSLCGIADLPMKKQSKNTTSAKWVQIYYSWGEQEAPVEVPFGIEPQDYMLQLILEEAERTLREHESVSIYLPEVGKGLLKYHYDDSVCYYCLTEEEDFVPEF